MVRKFLLLALTIIAFTSCKNETSEHNAIKTEEISFSKDGELTLYNSDSVKLKKVDIEVARSEYEQQTGLMYRKSMKKNRGMLFVYDDERPRPNFYMKNTYIGLDLIYINADYKVVDINENAQALDETPIPSDAKAKYVLETNAGMAEKWGIQKGDRISLKIN